MGVSAGSLYSWWYKQCTQQEWDGHNIPDGLGKSANWQQFYSMVKDYLQCSYGHKLWLMDMIKKYDIEVLNDFTPSGRHHVYEAENEKTHMEDTRNLLKR